MKAEEWIVYIIIFIPTMIVFRQCTGQSTPKINCNDINTYCYQWKSSNKTAAVVKKGGRAVEIRTPVGTGQGFWVGPGDASAKVFFSTKPVACYGSQSTSRMLGYEVAMGFCTD